MPAESPQRLDWESQWTELYFQAYLDSIERKWQKLREECELKDCSIQEMNIMIEEHDKQSVEALQLVKHQYAQEKGALKEQIIQNESHIEKL